MKSQHDSPWYSMCYSVMRSRFGFRILLLLLIITSIILIFSIGFLKGPSEEDEQNTFLFVEKKKQEKQDKLKPLKTEPDTNAKADSNKGMKEEVMIKDGTGVAKENSQLQGVVEQVMPKTDGDGSLDLVKMLIGQLMPQTDGDGSMDLVKKMIGQLMPKTDGDGSMDLVKMMIGQLMPKTDGDGSMDLIKALSGLLTANIGVDGTMELVKQTIQPLISALGIDEDKLKPVMDLIGLFMKNNSVGISAEFVKDMIAPLMSQLPIDTLLDSLNSESTKAMVWSITKPILQITIKTLASSFPTDAASFNRQNPNGMQIPLSYDFIIRIAKMTLDQTSRMLEDDSPQGQQYQMIMLDYIIEQLIPAVVKLVNGLIGMTTNSEKMFIDLTTKLPKALEGHEDIL